MKVFQDNFENHVRRQPDTVAITNAEKSISYAMLADEIKLIRQLLREHKSRRIAIAVSNSPAWIAFDLAAAFNAIPVVPIPHFFSQTQILHLINDAGIDAVIMGDEIENNLDFKTFENIERRSISVFDGNYWLVKFKGSTLNSYLPPDTIKISYTSGTTGQPKGVTISASQVDKVISSLVFTLNASSEDRHLSVLPFSLLLENIAGIYAVLAAGGQCMVPDFPELGLSGSSSLNVVRFIQAIQTYKPTTMITVPALAQALVMGSEQLGVIHESLRFIAVGGAPLSESIIEKAYELGLPLFEGYGLTECSSVVALNTANEYRTGSVGKPLPHIEIAISDTGEILVSGALCSGYINDGYLSDSNANKQLNWATGDLGYLDEDGFLFITGRKRTTYCTAYGRNISPEWVERELVILPQISQALIYGEGRSFNLAIIVPNEQTDDAELDTAITTVNQQLPDYAHISQWIKAKEPYSVTNQQLSASGIIQREQILTDYKTVIDHIYQ